LAREASSDLLTVFHRELRRTQSQHWPGQRARSITRSVINVVANFSVSF